MFQDTIDRLVILALFLPVLAGQSGNTGCQALAVTLRGMTLGELKPGSERPLVMKETWVGCLNGVGVGDRRRGRHVHHRHRPASRSSR
jgi:magnesium transporter